jgi:hypothetical protein
MNFTAESNVACDLLWAKFCNFQESQCPIILLILVAGPSPVSLAL